MAGALVVVILTALGGWTQMVRAEVGGSGGGFTDYGNYPPALPENCPEGPDALVGVGFTSSNGASAGDLWSLGLAGGDTVTMSWDAAAAGCAAPSGQPAVDITLASHRAKAPAFEVGEDQLLLDWASCGPISPCDVGSAGRYQLALTIPTSAVACQAQLDAVLGPPLGVVGPGGSYYTGTVRPQGGATMLVAAGRADSVPCEETPTTPTAPPGAGGSLTPPETPASDTTPPETPPTDTGGVTTGSETANPGPVTEQTVTATNTPAATVLPATQPSTNVAAAVESASVVPTVTAQPATAVLGTRVTQADLPRTGAPTDEMVVVASMLILVGAMVRTVGARAERRQALGTPGGA